MRVGLIDVDSHHFPNLALMRISAYHKAQGDLVEWWLGDLFHYDIVYMAKVFSAQYSADIPEPLNADRIIKGGSGYCITLKDGREIFDKEKHANLPPEIEAMAPDYSIYPEYDFAVAFTSRGCPRGCPFCIVGKKEGLRSTKVADVSTFYRGQKRIEVLDQNITACAEKHDLFEQYIETGAYINFNQGLDMRLITEEDISYLNRMKMENIHFAWDNPRDDLRAKFETYAKYSSRRPHGRFGMVYVLTGFNSTLEEDLYRVYTLRDLGYDPFVMIYNRPDAPKQLRHLQRWCNNKKLFRTISRFEDYDMLS